MKYERFVFSKINPPIIKWVFAFLTHIYTTVEVFGEENIPKEGSYVVMSNHLSNADTVIICRVFKDIWPIGAKVISNPIFRFLIRLGYNLIYIEKRDDANRNEKKISFDNAFNYVVEEPRKGRKIILVFPEGTRSRNGQLQKGQKRTASLALEAGVPILPVALMGTEKAMPINDNKKTIYSKTWGRLPRKTDLITMKIGKLLVFAKDMDPQECVDSVECKIALLLPREYADIIKKWRRASNV